MASPPSSDAPGLEPIHLRRETRTALELALVALAPLAPSDLLDRLATCAGLLEALTELPLDSPPVRALLPDVSARARAALDAWQRWSTSHVTRVQA